MNDEEIRLECLRMASGTFNPSYATQQVTSAVELAATFYNFVKGKTPDPEPVKEPA